MFGRDFKQSINGVLPPSLTSLDLSISIHMYDMELNTLPSSLTEIYLPSFFSTRLDHTPLQRLHVRSFVPSGPYPNLRKLWITDYTSRSNFNPTRYPSLTGLYIKTGEHVQDLSPFPMVTLKCFRMSQPSGRFDMMSVINPIPFGIEKLALDGCQFKLSNAKCLPNSIRRLELKGCMGMRPDSIPQSVTWLSLNVATQHWWSTDKGIFLSLRPSLNHLTVSVDKIFAKNRLFKQLPTSIRSLILELNIGHVLPLLRLSDRTYFRYHSSPSSSSSTEIIPINSFGFMDIDAVNLWVDNCFPMRYG
ncbi:hypothetical protein SAMD00019534_067040 [Acytostelium subglobosum LB1]|uniref:hypothetical protein n=1 Tax=Acytostelium subglobosum LB1 TaxID=1410327 RepID=UPI0006449670|nr:hypothetical protein SAMD00019534_067040 [Acytostelium subglobosum LB1]GAM23529.1 hypothetical protein SAMD00019534_067040 [Acytostelium subglobosum LB1]|eukprot:XP_012753270.1 hypothetical protein SAMD00019534_067040 [Acytostelium subglobosum LB1]